MALVLWRRSWEAKICERASISGFSRGSNKWVDVDGKSAQGSDLRLAQNANAIRAQGWG